MHCWWKRKLVQSLWKAVWRFLKQLKRELPYDPAIPLLGIYPEKFKTYPQEMKILTPKDIFKSMFTEALFTRAKTWKQPKCPPKGEWVKKILFSHRKE